MARPDGFIQLDRDSLGDSALNLNISTNEFSAFAEPSLIRPISNDLIVDHYYGLSYETMELLPAAIYGKTEDIPLYSGDSLSNDGFLRVPFRRIPRRIVRSRAEIEDLVGSIRSADENLRILFRGQCREYLIKRSPETSRWLYGADSVLEPSLVTSASRRKPGLESILPEWCSLLRTFASRLQIDKDFATDTGFPLFALALAQHYGLPTSGLDLTDRLDIALFFALMEYQKALSGHEGAYRPLVRTSHMPVLYILSPSKNQQFDYERYRSEGFPSGRPDVQFACFMHVGWGHADNLCASRIFLALYLHPEGDFGPIPSASKLFPANDADLFAAFLTEARKRNFAGALGTVLSEGFYTISDRSIPAD